MKTFKDIFDSEKMEMPNEVGICRLQRFNSDMSVSFRLDDDSRDFYGNIYHHLVEFMSQL